VKTTLAIVCSLVLAGAPIARAQAPGACVVRATCACCQGERVHCCAAPASPEPPPAAAAPAPSNSHQNQTPVPALTPPVWILPETEAGEGSFLDFELTPVAAAPLYARNCARLL